MTEFGYIECPYCREEIKQQAIKCKHCKTMLNQTKNPTTMINNPMDKIGRVAFIDVETTGLSPFEDEIIELALVLVSFNRETGELLELLQKYSGLRKPSKPIPKNAIKIHGITDKDVKGKNLDNKAILRILNQAEFIVAHNASFDYQFAIYYMKEFEGLPWCCAMKQVKWPGKSKALKNIAKLYGLEDAVKHHRAINDVALMVELLNRNNEHGERFFYELLQAGPAQEGKQIKFKPIRL